MMLKPLRSYITCESEERINIGWFRIGEAHIINSKDLRRCLKIYLLQLPATFYIHTYCSVAPTSLYIIQIMYSDETF